MTSAATITLTADQAAVARAVSKLSPAAARALRTADADGIVRKSPGVTDATLRGLINAHLGTGRYPQHSICRTLLGVRLNGWGLKLAAALTTDINA